MSVEFDGNEIMKTGRRLLGVYGYSHLGQIWKVEDSWYLSRILCTPQVKLFDRYFRHKGQPLLLQRTRAKP